MRDDKNDDDKNEGQKNEDGAGGSMDLLNRVTAILVRPQSEWKVIAREPDDAAGLFKSYVAILAAIPALCGLIGSAIVGVSIPGIGAVRAPIGAALGAAVAGYALSFVMVYVLALVVDRLAPKFGGRQDFPSALKLAVYASTPAWLVGVFLLIPALGFLGILALYALYLVWTGVPIMMDAAPERALAYTGAVFAVALLMVVIVAAIQSLLIGQ